MQYIIYLGIIFMPDKNAASQRANAFISMIKKIGYEPIIIGMSEEKNNSILESKNNYRGCVYYSMNYPNNSFEWLRSIVSINDIMKVVEHIGVNNIKAIIAMDYYSIALHKIMRFCRRESITFIVDAVDWFEKSGYSFPKSIIKDFDTCYRMKYLYKHTEKMITISSYLYDFYKKHVEQIVQIPGIVINNEINKSLKVDKNVRSIAFVGSPGVKCEKEKIDWVIKSVCKMNQKQVVVKFYIAGIDKKTLFDNRHDIASIKNFDESVVCYGRMSHVECLQLVKSCDFSSVIRKDSLLSRAGFPTKISESFACGTPVLVTPTSNICDFLTKQNAIIASDCTFKATYKAIKKCVKMSDNEIQSMKKAVKAYNPLSPEMFYKQLEMLI